MNICMFIIIGNIQMIFYTALKKNFLNYDLRTEKLCYFCSVLTRRLKVRREIVNNINSFI